MRRQILSLLEENSRLKPEQIGNMLGIDPAQV
ncbi:MAG: winged helix-turn-helix transcriptional regulator, partial [Clostridia bacterium]|nr:winged helix-turn-helix transcriptional regulator [Clostridia bacterium]